MATRKYWMWTPKESTKMKPSELDKKTIQDYFSPLVESFKSRCIKENPNKEYNYIIDIYSKWVQNYFYLCEKFKSEYPQRIKDEFEVKFVRLKYTDRNQFEFSYYRHTGQWHLVAENLSMEDCKEMILSNPIFQPIG